jgi:mycothiol synthase
MGSGGEGESGGASAAAGEGGAASGAVDARLARLIARARAADGHPPFSDGALAELATGAREVIWLDDVAAAVRTVAGASSASVTEAEFVVDPDARRHGHGRALLHRLLVDAPGDLLVWAHGGHPGARRLAASHGLEPVRELLHLRGAVPSGAEFAWKTHAAGEPLATLANSVHGAVDALLATNARAFAEHPEQGRLTRAEFDALAAEPWFAPEDVLLAWDGDRLAGFCWLKVEGGESGEFYVVGVDPDYQGQGWGRRLVEAGMARLASRGIRGADLYVEADNAPALRLYREFGFREDSIDIQYRWRSDPGH